MLKTIKSSGLLIEWRGEGVYCRRGTKACYLWIRLYTFEDVIVFLREGYPLEYFTSLDLEKTYD